MAPVTADVPLRCIPTTMTHGPRTLSLIPWSGRPSRGRTGVPRRASYGDGAPRDGCARGPSQRSPCTPPWRRCCRSAPHDDEPDVDLDVAPLPHDVASDQFEPERRPLADHVPELPVVAAFFHDLPHVPVPEVQAPA